MLLGQKTRVDMTIAGLLQHQITIVQQMVLMLLRQVRSTRNYKMSSSKTICRLSATELVCARKSVS
jgi:hypothetical protein